MLKKKVDLNEERWKLETLAIKNEQKQTYKKKIYENDKQEFGCCSHP